MCLRVFVPPEQYDALAPGACRLGAAFQKVNFLRDLAADHQERGRSYFPGLDPLTLTEADKTRLLDDVDADLAAALPAARALPASSRSAVLVAHAVFAELSARLRAVPAERIVRERVRLSGPTKARVALATLLRDRRR
jgi:phytoene/squalene synthetase